MAERDFMSPVDLDDVPGGERPALGWAAGAIATASLFLLLTNAVSIQAWADELTPSPAQAVLSSAADGWVAIGERTGLASPRAGLHALWKRAQAATF